MLIVDLVTGHCLFVYLLNFFIDMPLIYNLILVSNVKHSGSAVAHLIKSSPKLLANIEGCYRVIDYVLHGILLSPLTTHIKIE